MFAQVGLQTPARQGLLVPVQAIVNRSGRNIVFVVEQGANGQVVRSREVQVGINDGRMVEILPGANGQTGVQPGEDVAISALDVLSDGTPVAATKQG
jgi:multidrug efflux pump subunit AcrA (membrane-fusion protein)